MKYISVLNANGRGWVWPGLILCLWIVSAGFSDCTPNDSGETVRFDVGEGLAVETLVEAARQAEVEFIFSSELVQGLRTPAINGKYTPHDAFEMMLADSAFVVVQHEKSGVYSIQKSADQKDVAI